MSWGENAGVRKNPPDKRLPLPDSLKVARLTRDLNQQRSGTNWWDNGNREGAPTKAMQVWRVAYENPSLSHSAIARKAGVSRPTVIKWLKPGWKGEYLLAVDERRLAERRSRAYDERPRKVIVEQARQIQEQYADDRKGLEENVIRHVVAWPWKSFAEVAVFMGLSGPEEVERIINENRDLYNQTLLGISERFEGSDLDFIGKD